MTAALQIDMRLKTYTRMVMNTHADLCCSDLPPHLLLHMHDPAAFVNWYDAMLARLESIGLHQMRVFLKGETPTFRKSRSNHKNPSPHRVRRTMMALANALVLLYLDPALRTKFYPVLSQGGLVLSGLRDLFAAHTRRALIPRLVDPPNGDPDALLRRLRRCVRHIPDLDENANLSRAWILLLFLSLMGREYPQFVEKVYDTNAVSTFDCDKWLTDFRHYLIPSKSVPR